MKDAQLVDWMPPIEDASYAAWEQSIIGENPNLVVKLDDESSADRLIKALSLIVKAEPTPAQIEAGNYKKQHIKFAGLDVSVENPAGSVRSGTDKAGNSWQTQMHNDYGYIKRTEGIDGDHVDVYLGPNEDAEYVYVVHQAKPDSGEYDEDKCMVGFDDPESAKAAYLKHYDRPEFFGSLTAVPMSLFKMRLDEKGEPIVPDAASKMRSMQALEKAMSALVIKHPGHPDQSVHNPHKEGQAKMPPKKELNEKIDTLSKKTGLSREEIQAAYAGTASPNDYHASNARARLAEAILKHGLEVPNAALLVQSHDDTAQVTKTIWKLTNGNGDIERAQKEYADTPLCDLQVLSRISVLKVPVHGQANCNMATRAVTMGSTSVTGDFRHELGHALHAALGGAKGLTQKNALTSAIADHYNKVKERMVKNPAGVKTKLSHDWYEDNYGVIGKRGTDNWHEDFAEHYRGYHKAIYRDAHEGGQGAYLEQYRQRHPEMAKVFDAHYTAALFGQQMLKGNL